EEMSLRRWAAEAVAATGDGQGVQVLDPVRLASGTDAAPKLPADLLAQAKSPPAGPPGTPVPPKAGVGSTFDLIGPRGTVTASPLNEFGAVIVTANNQADLDLAIKIIKQLQEYLRSPEALANAPKLKIVELKYGDAVGITNLVNQLGARATGVAVTQRPGQGAQAFPFGGFGPQAQTQQGAAGGSVLLLPLARQNAILM